MRTNSQFLEFLEKIKKTMQLQNDVKDKNDDNTEPYFENEENKKGERTSIDRTEMNYDNSIKYDFLGESDE